MKNSIFYLILIIFITTIILKKKNKEKFITCETGHFLGENEKCIKDKSNFGYDLTNLNILSENLEKLKSGDKNLDLNLKVDKIKNADKIIVKKSGSKIKKLDSNNTNINRLYGGKKNKFRGWRTIDMDNRFFFNNNVTRKEIDYRTWKTTNKPINNLLGFDEEGIKYSKKIYSYLLYPVKIHKLKKNNHVNNLIKDKDIIQVKTTYDKGLHNARKSNDGKVLLWGPGHWYQIHMEAKD